ncbi:odorant receptor 131-2-like [Syngnathoides biaculeatus]|uniref:odorant receptor 131-2-like n=1 Tax=Syngnathoides biaculeatus TaxID=300417 RepID=UPI002ADE073B|nr:odorant receptor 131-2-like [Syngnathoides biaculeatus]
MLHGDAASSPVSGVPTTHQDKRDVAYLMYLVSVWELIFLYFEIPFAARSTREEGPEDRRRQTEGFGGSREMRHAPPSEANVGASSAFAHKKPAACRAGGHWRPLGGSRVSISSAYADAAAAAAANASRPVEYRDSLGKAAFKNVLVLAIGLSINYVNACLIYTFCRHQIFYSSPRYILFFHLVLNDMIQMSASVILFVVSYTLYKISVSACAAFILMAVITSENTPLNLACMAAECYVAVCLPLRRARICTVGKTLVLIASIWTVSVISTFPDLLVTLATEPPGFFSSDVFCLRETAFPSPTLAQKRDVTYIAYLVLVWSVIFCLYFKILFTARSASKDAKKARRTIVLHGVQVLLCMTMYAEALVKLALLRWFPENYSDSLFACYVVVQILPRAISPIIYGVRDKCFRKYLKLYLSCKGGLQ